MSSPSALFQNESAIYAPFKTLGTHYEGEIVALGEVQAKDYKTQDLVYWPDGKAKMIAIITIQTELRDPEIVADDGQRAIWVSSQTQTKATREAIRLAGAAKRGVEVGGHFSIKFTHEAASYEGGNPAKHYEVTYSPPAEKAAEAPMYSQGGQLPAQEPIVQRQGPEPVIAASLEAFDLAGMTPQAQAALKAMLAAQAQK